jgi:DMSO/TMAO reductase YedYZ molybdopterin-dependent catalytic subunit
MGSILPHDVGVVRHHGNVTDPSVTSRGRLAAAGALTGVAGLAVSLAAAALLRERLTPPDAVAEAVIDATPGKAVSALVDVFGRWDKPLLIIGVVVVLVLLSALAGLVTRRALWRGQAVFLAMATAGAVAALTRPQSSLTALLPVLAGALTWIGVLPFLTSVPSTGAAGADGTGASGDTSDSRRRFLRRAGVVALAALAVGVGSRFLGRQRRVVEEARAELDLPVTEGEVPQGAQLDLPELKPWRTSNSDFYRIDTAVVVPAVAAADWRLRIHGMVEEELVLSYQDLLDRGLTESWVTLCCVSNPVGGQLVGNAWWSGVRVADLLAEARPLSDADAVLQTSEDGWTCGTPLAALTDDRDALLAVAMNGEPLPIEHGFPVRMVVPGLYGYVSATKWLVDLEVSRFDDFEAFWTGKGWSEEGPVRTQSRIDVPRANHRVMAGSVPVGGVAWAQHTGIESVEVRLDGGPWTPVELGRVPSADTWVQWAGTVEADQGVHTLAVRATDRSGYEQTGVQRAVAPDGATGWHTIEFTAE